MSYGDEYGARKTTYGEEESEGGYGRSAGGYGEESTGYGSRGGKKDSDGDGIPDEFEKSQYNREDVS
jgi:hypothetical protein